MKKFFLAALKSNSIELGSYGSVGIKHINLVNLLNDAIPIYISNGIINFVIPGLKKRI